MKTILFLTNMFPFPGNSGGTIKTRKLIDGLLENNKLILCFLDTNRGNQIDLWKNEYAGQEIVFKRVYNGNNIRSVKNMLFSIVNRVPLNVYRNKCAEMKRTVSNILKQNKIDVILADHLEVFQYIPKEWQDKTILHEHNAEYKIWSRYAKTKRSFFIRAAISYEAGRIEKYEKRACRKASIVMAAPKDLEFISDGDYSVKYIRTNHLGNDEILKLPKMTYHNNSFDILFIGTLTWKANIEGIRWFIDKVLPLIKEVYSEVKVTIIGKFKENEFADINDKNVHFMGFVDDLEEYVKKATVFICPLFFGSGMKVKIIEAMYRGIPFVTTSIGIENIKYFDEQHTYKYPYAGMVADTPEEFAAGILALYENKSMWEDASKTARLIAGSEYLWKDEIRRFRKVIESF